MASERGTTSISLAQKLMPDALLWGIVCFSISNGSFRILKKTGENISSIPHGVFIKKKPFEYSCKKYGWLFTICIFKSVIINLSIVKIEWFFFDKYQPKTDINYKKLILCSRQMPMSFPLQKKAEITTKFYESATESSTLQLGHYLTMP